jgi:putative DNA primase/helicase
LITLKSTQRSNVADKLKSAKELMNLGFKILPLKPGTKVPMTRHGVKDATKDFATFQRLIAASGDFEIGIATGSASNVIVFDVDPRNGGLRAFVDLSKRFGPLPNTLICQTGGGGRHYYIQPPYDEIRKKVLAPGVELLADGCYVVGPPSLHSSGKPYKWLGGRGPDKQKVAALPDSWEQFISDGNPARNEAVAPAGDEIPEGSRNIELTRVGGKMRRAGLSEADMLAALRGVNTARCRPPLDDREVSQIARNIAQYAVGVEPRDEGQKIAQALLDAQFAGGR